MGPSVWGGNTLARRLAGSYSPTIPWCILPDGPPNTRGPLEVLVGLFTDFSDFLGRLLVIVEFYSPDYLGLMALGLQSDKAERDSEKHGAAPNSEQQRSRCNVLACRAWRTPTKPTLNTRRNLKRLSTKTSYNKQRFKVQAKQRRTQPP